MVIDAYVVAVITEAEDKRLSRCCLQSKMPKDRAGLDAPLARWKRAGIEVRGLDGNYGQPDAGGPKFGTKMDGIAGGPADPFSGIKRLNRFMIETD